MPRKTLKRQRKQRGGKVGFLPIIDDIWRVLYNKLHANPIDKKRNRKPIFAKINALKELISWIELSLGNIKRSAIKSHDPIITQIANRALFNRFNNDYFSKNLVTSEQLIDYFDHMYTFEDGLQQKYIQAVGYILIRYLKQIYILITGSTTGSIFDNTENYEKILFLQGTKYEKELPESSTFSVSEKYSKFLTDKFGKTYLDILKKNYIKVRDFINTRIRPNCFKTAKIVKIPELVAALEYSAEDEVNDNINHNSLIRTEYREKPIVTHVDAFEYTPENTPENKNPIGTHKDDTPYEKTYDNTDLPVASTSLASGGTRKKQIRNKPRKNKTGKKQYK